MHDTKKVKVVQYSNYTSNTAHSVTGVLVGGLRRCYMVVTQLLQGCYRLVRDLLQPCYSTVTGMYKGCYRGFICVLNHAAGVLQVYQIGLTGALQRV